MYYIQQNIVGVRTTSSIRTQGVIYIYIIYIYIYEGDVSANSALVDLPPKSLKLGPESR